MNSKKVLNKIPYSFYKRFLKKPSFGKLIKLKLNTIQKIALIYSLIFIFWEDEGLSHDSVFSHKKIFQCYQLIAYDLSNNTLNRFLFSKLNEKQNYSYKNKLALESLYSALVMFYENSYLINHFYLAKKRKYKKEIFANPISMLQYLNANKAIRLIIECLKHFCPTHFNYIFRKVLFLS